MILSPADVGAVHRLALEHVTPFVCWGGAARVDRGLIKLLSRLGLVAPFFAAEFGGSGDGRVSATLLCNYREGLARVSPEASTALATQIGGIFVAARHASEAIRREWIPRVVAGEVVTAIALTEPDRGSDAASMAMPATRVAGGWRLSGKKVWIMKAPDADVYTVFARTSGSAGPSGITAFLVPKETPGLTGVAIDALWPDRVGNIIFENVFVADSHVIGQVDEGFKLGMGVFDAFRPSVGAHMLGLAQIALKHSIRYAKDRRAFGQPIARYQAVSHPLANVRDVFNAVLVKGDATGEVMLYGRGAGMMPTASAIIADVVDAARGSARQAFTKLQFFQNPRADMPVIPMSKTRSRYYVRFRVADRPGAMGKIASLLGEMGVSIASVIQKEPQESGDVPIVMLTHTTIEERFQKALTEIEKLPFVRKPSCFFRVED